MTPAVALHRTATNSQWVGLSERGPLGSSEPAKLTTRTALKSASGARSTLRHHFCPSLMAVPLGVRRKLEYVFPAQLRAPARASAEPARIGACSAALVGKIVQLSFQILLAPLKCFQFRVTIMDDDDILREASRRIH